jgi:hypothetical protein
MLRQALVINQEGFLVEHVAVDPETLMPFAYELAPGESVVTDVVDALDMLKPRWDGSQWHETATPEEIEAAQPEPPPDPYEPSNYPPPIDRLYEHIVQLEARVKELENEVRSYRR